jgi:hypothetical protein
MARICILLLTLAVAALGQTSADLNAKYPQFGKSVLAVSPFLRLLSHNHIRRIDCVVRLGNDL